MDYLDRVPDEDVSEAKPISETFEELVDVFNLELINEDKIFLDETDVKLIKLFARWLDGLSENV